MVRLECSLLGLIHTRHHHLFAFPARVSLVVDPAILPYCMAVLTFGTWGLDFEGQLLSTETE